MTSIFKLRENLDFIKNSVAEPTVFEPEEIINIDLEDDLGLSISTSRMELYISPAVFKSSMLSVIGITGLIQNKMSACASDYEELYAIIKNTVKENIRNFVFYVDHLALPMEAVMVKPTFDKDFEPNPVAKEVLPELVCTAHLPIESDEDFYVSNFDHDMKDKVFTLSLSKIEDFTKPMSSVVHNTAKIAWMSNTEKWEQRASIYDRERDMLYTLPRNYGKKEYKQTSTILAHVDTLIEKLDMNADYSKEFNEMLIAKLPPKAQTFLMELVLEDHKLKTILDTIYNIRENIKPSMMKNLYKCLGYMIAQKIHCCTECRHLDEETL